MSFFSLTPTKQKYCLEVNGKVLDSEFELVAAEKTAKAYADEGFKVMMFDNLTGRLIGSFGN